MATEGYRRHVLKGPMVVYSGGPQSRLGVLPEGTSLRYQSSLPEGVDRYQITLNVERFPLDLTEASPPDLVDPLSAFPPDEQDQPVALLSQLRALLDSLGVTRGQLESLLSSYQ